jgi:dolichyl-phosphooligosaccharide-protein glycotransferase
VLRKYAVPLLLLLFIGVAIALRMIPAGSLIVDGQVRFISTDPWFVMRQVEQVIHNFPRYAWFDPMTAFPDGKTIGWGPLFPVTVAAFCMIFGATARPEVGVVASLVPVILGAAMVPVMYLTGRVLRDKWTGLLAAGLIAVVASEYTWRSFFGYVDHHIMEVLLSTIFSLIYLTLLRHPGWKEMNLKDIHTDLRTWTTPLFLCLLAGTVYLLGLLNMPTMVLFALIVGIFTLIQGIADYFRGQSIAYLLVMNASIFGIVIIGFLIFGVKSTALSLATYSMAHVYVYLILIGATALIYVLSIAFPKKRLFFVLFMVGAGLLAAGISFIALPEFGQMTLSGAGAFFSDVGQPYYVSELQTWDLYRAVGVFNLGLILMAAGFLVLLYDVIRMRRTVSLFVLIWGAVMLFATIQHLRYEYYLAVLVALLSALAVSTAWSCGGADLRRVLRGVRGDGPPKKKSIQKPKVVVGNPSRKRAESAMRAASAAMAIILLVAFAVLSFTTVVVVANHQVKATDLIPDDWVSATTWMGTHTPETGVDYDRIYEQNDFHYPDTAYGVLAQWPAGHWITYIAHRIPNANPFQDHITGPKSIYVFLFAEDEDSALAISKALGTRYVVTDYGLATSLMAGNQSYGNGTLRWDNYTPVMIRPTDSGDVNILQFFSTSYFLTMATRLHNFDGSLVEPDKAFYVEYTWEDGLAFPVVTDMEQLSAAEARSKAANGVTTPEVHAVAVSGFTDQPVDVVPALRHFRLVYESPTNMRQEGLMEIKSVKIFEIVEGAHIRGEGIIEVPLVTNEGRQFIYRQQSQGGEFIVPYSTDRTVNGVRALGPYRITGSDMTFEVQEADVVTGRFVN